MPRSNRQTEKTEAALKTALLKELKTKPLAKISVTQLCRIADIDRTTFYIHFCDVYALMRNIEEDILQDIEIIKSEIIQKNDSDHTVVAILLTYMEHKKEILQILLKESDYCFWEKIHIGLTHLFKAKVLQQYRISDNVNMKELDDAIVFLTNGFYGIYRQWILSECKESANYIARYSARLSSACLKELLG